uniref:N-acetyltransferase domain-containing protein n=1 Tax=Graphocephala atropunctata TaxID=36148 RepID=A0A1B6KQ00_9HEMI
MLRNFLSLLGRNEISILPARHVSKMLPFGMRLEVTKEDVDDTLDFLNWTFLREEPVVQAMCIQDPCDLQRYIKRQVQQSIAMKVLDKNCETLAVALGTVVNPKSSEDLRTFAECSICDQRTKRLFNLWADISDSHNLFECFKVREIWEITILATSPEARGKGLGKILMMEARHVGKQEGLSITRVDCTSFYSAKLVYDLKYITLPPRHVLTYRDKKGIPWLPASPPHPHGHIVVAYDFLT